MIYFRSGIYVGTVLTFLGGLVRGLSTMDFLASSIDKNVQFWLGFVGQTFTGMGNPMAVAVPTKVSISWGHGSGLVVSFKFKRFYLSW